MRDRESGTATDSKFRGCYSVESCRIFVPNCTKWPPPQLSDRMHDHHHSCQAVITTITTVVSQPAINQSIIHLYFAINITHIFLPDSYRGHHQDSRQTGRMISTMGSCQAGIGGVPMTSGDCLVRCMLRPISISTPPTYPAENIYQPDYEFKTIFPRVSVLPQKSFPLHTTYCKDFFLEGNGSTGCL